MSQCTAFIRINKLPAPYRRPVLSACQRALCFYPNTLAFVIIGSVALGTWEPDSDVDVVWLLRGRRRKNWRKELDYDYSGVVEWVPLNLTGLRQHFARRSPMAHAIRRGIILYDPHGLIAPLQLKPLGPPSVAWMREWFAFFWHRLDWGLDSYRRQRSFHLRHCKSTCSCRVSDILTRAVVNLALVLITTRGLIPNCKAEMRCLYPRLIRGPRLRQAMETALQAHHEKRDLTLVEAAELVRLGKYLRARLTSLLGLPKSVSRLRHRAP